MAVSAGIRSRNVTHGLALILATALTISIQDVVFKLFSSNLTLWQIFALRGVFALPILLALGWVRRKHGRIVFDALRVWPLTRAACITLTFLAFYAAIPFLSLSTVGSANYIAPVFVTLLSAYVIREPVSPLGWVGVVLGFAGVLILLQPGTEAFSPWVLLPLVGAAFYAAAHIITRTRCQHVPLASLSFSQNTVMLLAGLFISGVLLILQPPELLVEDYPYIFGTWSSVDLTDWYVILLLAGLSITIGMMLAGAYQVAPPAIVSTFEYSYLVFVAIWDIVFFGITPSLMSLTGMIMIVAAGMLVLRGKSAV